jgi:hypothetical protein
MELTTFTNFRVAKLVHPDVAVGGPDGAAAFRRLGMEALDSCGMHITAGGSLHEMLCSFEAENVSTLLTQGAPQEQVAEALRCARAAWHRWIRTITDSSETAFAAYKEWEHQLPNSLRQEIPNKILMVRCA